MLETSTASRALGRAGATIQGKLKNACGTDASAPVKGFRVEAWK